jgi:DNA-binding response OmpR family regulator
MHALTTQRQLETIRVLIVEDEAAITRFLEDLLQATGHETIVAKNGVEALVALTSPSAEFPHVVILDLGLPLESGVSVLSFLRSVLGSGVPVIVLTGREDTDEEIAVRELGVSAYLRKPASPHQVVAAITKALTL